MAAYSRARILLSGSHTGVSIGEDGPSQMGLEDLAMMRSVFGSVVLSPADAVSAEKLTAAAAHHDGISYVRTIRGKTPILYENTEDFELGGSKVLKQSPNDHATFVATGYTVPEALAAAEELEKAKGISVRVIDCYSLKPVDEETLRKAAKDTDIIITAEDHYPEGGLGEIVSSVVSGSAAVHSLAVREMPHSGSPDELIREQGIDREGILRKFHELLGDVKS
jgi:transketolase